MTVKFLSWCFLRSNHLIAIENYQPEQRKTLQHLSSLTSLSCFFLASNIVLMSDKAVLVDFGLSVQMTEDIYIPRDLRGTEVREERTFKVCRKDLGIKYSLYLLSCLACSVCFRGRILYDSQPRYPQGLQNRTFRSCVCCHQRKKKMSDLLTEPFFSPKKWLSVVWVVITLITSKFLELIWDFFQTFTLVMCVLCCHTSWPLKHMHPWPVVASFFGKSQQWRVTELVQYYQGWH